MTTDTSTIPQEIIEAREKYTSITVHCPHMDKNLQPFPELLNSTCPMGKDGRCGDCEKFIGFWSEDGSIFSYMSFEGFCDNKN